jgi:carbon storage regulator CsrA
MLVLSRKVGERIHIGKDVFVEVRRVAGNRVTLAVDAPKSVRILRGELFKAAREFDVLEDAPVSEAAIDTVIMKQSPLAVDVPTDGPTDGHVQAPHVLKQASIVPAE